MEEEATSSSGSARDLTISCRVRGSQWQQCHPCLVLQACEQRVVGLPSTTVPLYPRCHLTPITHVSLYVVASDGTMRGKGADCWLIKAPGGTVALEISSRGGRVDTYSVGDHRGKHCDSPCQRYSSYV